MPFWVYGRDRETGGSAEFFSPALSEAEAREAAREQGIIIERVEADPDYPADSEAEAREAPRGRDILIERVGPDPRSSTKTSEPVGATELIHAFHGGFVGFCLSVAQFISVISCIFAIGAVLVGVIGLVCLDFGNGLRLFVLGLFGFFYSVAMLTVFTQAKHHKQA